MPRNGAGTYTLPSGNPVVTGTVISSTVQNNTMTDIATALTQSIASNGQTPITANIPMAGYKLTGLAAATIDGDAIRYQQVFPSLSTTTVVAGSGGITTTGTLSVSGGATIDTTTFVVDATNNRVGVNYAAPLAPLHVGGSTNTEIARFDDGTVAVSIGVTSSDGYIGTTTNDPIRVVYNGTTVATFTTGQMTLPHDGAIECSSGALFSQTVYNNTTATSADVSVSGIAGALRRSTSSLRYKFAVETVKPERSEFLYQMRPIWYRSACDGDRKDWSYYGFAAEEVAKLEPRIVHWEADPDKDGELRPSGLMYDRLTVFLVMEIQKLAKRLKALESK